MDILPKAETLAQTFLWLAKSQGWGVVNAALLVGSCVFAVAYLALLGLAETHGRDLDFMEQVD